MRTRIAITITLLPAMACTFVAGLDKDFIEVECLNCGEPVIGGPRDASLDVNQAPDATPDVTTDVDATESGVSDAGPADADPCGPWTKVDDPSVTNNPDYAGWKIPSTSSINRAQFIAEGDVVLDTITGLRWTKRRAPNNATLPGANAYCASLVLDGGAGWRLPTRMEMASLQYYREIFSPPNYTMETPCLHDAFDPPAPLQYWSSTISPQGGLWIFTMTSCGTIAYSVPDAELPFLCVQGPKAVPNFERSETCGIVRDLNTRLEWEPGLREAQSNVMPDEAFKDAKNTCRSLGQENPKLGQGWVVPTQKENYSIVDTSRKAPTINQVLFPGVGPGINLMSQTLRALNNPAVIDLATGEESGTGLGDVAYLKCVRHMPDP